MKQIALKQTAPKVETNGKLEENGVVDIEEAVRNVEQDKKNLEKVLDKTRLVTERLPALVSILHTYLLIVYRNKFNADSSFFLGKHHRKSLYQAVITILYSQSTVWENVVKKINIPIVCADQTE